MPQSRWKLLTSAAISLAILALAYLNRAWIVEAFGLLDDLRPHWLAASFILIGLSYLVSSQVFNIVLRSLGYRMGLLRLWATALVAIVISQSVPAGGVGSYAFLISNFSRRGVSSGESTLIASLETLSYAGAMLLMFSFSLLYLAVHGMVTGRASYVAGVVAVAVIGTAAFVLTRPEATLTRWLVGLQRRVDSLLGRPSSSHWAETLIAELHVGRELIASRRRDVALLVLVQLTALTGHSLAMLLVLHGLGVSVSLAAVATAFGIALITSTFNVLPGGGGTVEAALVAVLTQLGAGPAAVPAAIIFRLFNFWLLAPVAAACYHWLMHEQVRPLVRVGRPRSGYSSSPQAD
ncbi:MAG TPA: lysylphosphatidylglycerol synthase transmembrane domain-containing protein [Chloroflexaceae bacterium]|nr:lysylphosphatidylglycerol synthase transmembrane domain-containing protein [Chloroflexaceae bacterium]